MLDPAPARELPTTLLRRLTWITPNETEAAELIKMGSQNGDQDSYATADHLLASGVKNVLLKLGARGCLIAQPNHLKKLIPAFPVNAVDTTGAGDAFNAGFAVALMRGLPITQSAGFASATAAISVSRLGAQSSMPTSTEVAAFVPN
jgi:ribokinase